MSSDIPTVSENETSANRIAVNDANLFIDLCEIDLVEIFFELPLEFHTTQLILNELEEDQLQRLVPFIAQKQLSVRHLTQSEIDNLASISTQSRKLSREDLSVYFYAHELDNCMILTGDNRLRKEAQRQGFEVHGILWVFEQLVNIEVLSPLIASEKLRELMSINFWLPVGECDKLIEKFNLDHIK
ncbi:hypothetical protein [Runella sp.]|jgi:predicted nucleic acid-binding protein|uniref:hypothetical protein n=1 Tax=Runella sp. TaxID=1960881 RepID=UPI0026319ACE|nr:hypothetical protein [Runella sp.]